MSDLLLRLARASLAIVAHALLAALTILLTFGMERLIHLLWGQEQPLLFDRVPVAWLFSFVDFSILIVFSFNAVVTAIGELGRSDEGFRRSKE
jgi:hypothetical protein